MQPQEVQGRILTFPVDTVTMHGPFLPFEAPLSIAEFMAFHNACRQFFMSNRKLELTFLNGKVCTVDYSFDATRPQEERLLVNWVSLAPLFWTVPPGDRDYVKLPEVLKYVEKKLRFERCKAVASDTCSCGKKPNKVVSPGCECDNELHWHHYCTAHVSAWLTKYMMPAILLKESKEMFSEYMARVHQGDPTILEYYSTGEGTDTQMLLESARNINLKSGSSDK